MSPRSVFAVAFAATLGASSPSRAAPIKAPAPAPKSEKIVCVQASDEASRLRADGHLLASRKELLACAREVCPVPVRKDCTRRLGELDEVMPSVVVSAKDGDGHDLVDVRLTIDGVAYGDKLDGKAIVLDPGTHEFVFERAGLPAVREQVLVAEGVKNRVVGVILGAPRPAPPTAPGSSGRAESGGPPPAVWVLGGVGVLAFGSFAILGLTAKDRAAEMRTSCAPACSSADVDSVKTRALLADVSLGLGLVALSGAGYFYFTASSAPTRLGIGVTPLVGGAALGVHGAFR